MLYDSTTLYDSLLFALPPTNRNYRWTVSPDSAAVVLGGDYLHGRALVTFKAAGTYHLSAIIDDSASNTEVARTNTYTIQVQPDTLYPTTAIIPGEQVSISDGGFGVFNGREDGDDYSMELKFTTSGNYYSNSFIPYAVDSAGGITISFKDSTIFWGYPFYFGEEQPVILTVNLPYIVVGSTQPLSVVWLGTTYSGTITRTSLTQLNITWNNSGLVKVTNDGIFTE